MIAKRRLVVRMAEDNPTWGYTRIRGALKNVGPLRGPVDDCVNPEGADRQSPTGRQLTVSSAFRSDVQDALLNYYERAA